jgi:hypothetical protein
MSRILTVIVTALPILARLPTPTDGGTRADSRDLPLSR